jgi:hypothetical protein
VRRPFHSRLSVALSGSVIGLPVLCRWLRIVGTVAAQPTLIPQQTTEELLCSPGGAAPVDTSFAAQQDTVVAQHDADGFLSIFNGRDFTGWWQNCRTSHSSANRTSGAIFRVDTVREAIYATQRGNAGGILSTKKRYLHYEIVFEVWPGYGDDGGIFHRNPVGGQCYQTVLDYLGGASWGGTWGEGGFGSRDHRPFVFSGNDSTLSIPGRAADPGTNWTTFTANRLAAGEQFPCPSTGCTQAEWRQHWKLGSNPAVEDGWNTMRIQFYGGTRSGEFVRMRSWFRSRLDDPSVTRIDSMAWIPIWSDSMTYNASQLAWGGVPNPIGIQVHGGGRFSSPRGTWFRNIRVRELDSLGTPLYIPDEVSIRPSRPQEARYDIRVVSSKLTGTIDLDYTIKINDVSGRLLERFDGRAGRVEHALPARSQGALLVEIRTARGVQHLRVAGASD